MLNKYIDISKEAEKSYRVNRELIRKLKRRPPADLDQIFKALHEKAFSRINCLECANCCRTLGPRITDRDIVRIARYLKVRPAEFTGKYLCIDEDRDYVFKSMPCPFLESDNSCSIYEQRPSACRDYPHTDRKKMHQVLDLTLKNSFTCPGVLEVLRLVISRQ